MTEEEEIYAIEQEAVDYDELFTLFASPNYIYEEDPAEEASQTAHATVYWLSVMMKLPLDSIEFFSAMVQERQATKAA